jgi:hypothetical protein
MAGGEVSTRIDSVNRTERLGPHEHIRNIGGIRAAGSCCRLSQDDGIEGIDQGKWTFTLSAQPGMSSTW